MGYDATCTLRIDGRTLEGKALLEQHELIFRGPERIVIPIKDVASAVAEAGTLTIRVGRKTATLELGPAAAKWARRITDPPSRLDKLGAKAGMSALVTGTRHPDLIEELEARGVIVASSARQPVDLIFYGAEDRAALERVTDLKHKLKPSGALWVIRPKGTTTISEAEVMAAGKRAGLVDVKVASFSDTHTAEKFVVPRAQRG